MEVRTFEKSPFYKYIFSAPGINNGNEIDLMVFLFSFLSAFILLLIHVTYYSQRHSQEGLWGLSPPPRKNEIY